MHMRTAWIAFTTCTCLATSWRSSKFIFSLSYPHLFNLSSCLSRQCTLWFSHTAYPSLHFLHTLAHAAPSAWKSTLPFSTWQALTHPSNSRTVTSAMKTSLLHPNRALPLYFCNILFILLVNTGAHFIVSDMCLFSE